MSLPSELYIPFKRGAITSDDVGAADAYFQDVIGILQAGYGDLASSINGLMRTDAGAQDTLWTPVLADTLAAGTTFTYAANGQVGWVLRRGLMVDVFFNLVWTAASAALAGNMYVKLPYKVAVTNGKPFVGVVQTSTFAYTGGSYCVINGISNSVRGEVWNCGSAFTTANQQSKTTGTLCGHLRYIGQADGR